MENSNEVLKLLYYDYRKEYGLSGINKMLKVITAQTHFEGPANKIPAVTKCVRTALPA